MRQDGCKCPRKGRPKDGMRGTAAEGGKSVFVCGGCAGQDAVVVGMEGLARDGVWPTSFVFFSASSSPFSHGALLSSGASNGRRRRRGDQGEEEEDTHAHLSLSYAASCMLSFVTTQSSTRAASSPCRWASGWMCEGGGERSSTSPFVWRSALWRGETSGKTFQRGIDRVERSIRVAVHRVETACPLCRVLFSRLSRGSGGFPPGGGGGVAFPFSVSGATGDPNVHRLSHC